MTKSNMQEPNGVRLSAVASEQSDAPRGKGPAQPHPEDWPADISEPEFLELTQVYSGDEPRGGETPAPGEHAEPDPRHPLPGDEMRSYRGPEDVVPSADLTQGRPGHAPQDFIAEPGEPAASRIEPLRPEDAEHAGSVENGPATAPGSVTPHPAATRETTPTIEDIERAYPAEKARQGRIVLDKPEMRALFIGGLVGTVIVVLAMLLLEMA